MRYIFLPIIFLGGCGMQMDGGSQKEIIAAATAACQGKVKMVFANAIKVQVDCEDKAP